MKKSPPSGAPRGIDKKYLILLAIGGFIIALDQLTKLYIHTHFHLGESISVLPDFFNITYVRNKGAAFGIFNESHETFRTLFFLIMPPIAVGIVLHILRSVPSDDHLQIVALSGVFGGAIGNYIDRLRFGYVIDFLDFHIQQKYSWPAFNVADSAIVGGIGVMMYLMVLEAKREKEMAKSRATASSS